MHADDGVVVVSAGRAQGDLRGRFRFENIYKMRRRIRHLVAGGVVELQGVVEAAAVDGGGRGGGDGRVRVVKAVREPASSRTEGGEC